MGQKPAPTEKRKHSLYFSAEILREIGDEATRQDRSLSWIVQKAWKLARREIRGAPSRLGQIEFVSKTSLAFQPAEAELASGLEATASQVNPESSSAIDAFSLDSRRRRNISSWLRSMRGPSSEKRSSRPGSRHSSSAEATCEVNRWRRR
jgi:uncharacterized small protein (TIGR04563 family)